MLIVTGALSLALALVGIVLPLLPTVPFLLLTAACWSRASPRWHRWLLARPRLGPAIVRWERERTVPRRAKFSAVALIVLSMGASIWLLRDHPWLPWALAAVAVPVLAFILRLRETRDGA
nr:YbaN family protein [Rhodanobacter sp. B2A1Ga4]